MNSTFEKSYVKYSDEWFTPKYILDALGEFDLDPCAAVNPLWQTAKNSYTKESDGLKQVWHGSVFLNPPYSKPLCEDFVAKLAAHGDGIAMLYNRADAKWFRKYVFDAADAILFLSKRVRFYRQDGTLGLSPGAGSLLVAYGDDCVQRLKRLNLDGTLIYTNKYIKRQLGDLSSKLID